MSLRALTPILVVACLLVDGQADGQQVGRPRKMIPATQYRNPFLLAPFKDRMRIEAFRLDEQAVKVREYLEFIRRRPQWAKSKAKPMFVDSLYLRSWKGDLRPLQDRLEDPVTEVSWFAANAYCNSLGARLPSTDEWESVATRLPKGVSWATFTAKILDWYSHPAGSGRVVSVGSRDAFGVRDLHGRVWEWTLDFDNMSLNQGEIGSGKPSSFFCGGSGLATSQGADYASYMRFALRASLKPNFSTGALGFRCAEDAGTSSATPVPMGLSALPNESLYQLKSPWTTDLGKRIQLENLRGKLRLVSLFFGHCESSCPMVLGKLKAVVNSSSDIWGDKAGIILVSLDPKRDDVESLSAFRKRMSLAPEAWTLLRGNEQDTRELAMALGVAYRPSTENGGMDHNAVVVLVDGVGRILNRHEGTFEVKELIDEVEAAIPKL